MLNQKVRKGIPKNRWRIANWKETKSNKLVYGSYGLKASEFGRISAKQIEAARKAIRRHVKNSSSIRIRIYPNIPVTNKPAEVRMGKGKGAIDHWVCFVKAGRILFEITENLPLNIAKLALTSGGIKLPISTKFTSVTIKNTVIKNN